MFVIRGFLLALTLTVVAACSTEPLVDASTASTIVPRNIVVDTSGITGVVGRDLVVSPDQVQADITAALETALARDGTGNADVFVTVEKVQLIARGASVAFLQSNVQAVLRVTDVAGDVDFIAPTEITGNSEQLRLGGAIGVITAPTAEVDYQQTIRGFAASVRNRLYGAPEAS